MQRHSIGVWLVLATGFLFGLLYFAIGRQIAAHGLLRNDIFFHSDLERVEDDIAIADCRHHRTSVHPLFVLFANPAGSILDRLFQSRENTALFINSIVAAAAIAATGLFFLRAGVSLLRSELLTLILGSSAAHLFFGSVPETYSFSALSIILLFHAAMTVPPKTRAILPAAIFSFGILITNLAIAAIAYGTSLLPNISWPQRIRKITGFTLLVIFISGALATIQILIWNQTQLFFVPAGYTNESRFITLPSRPLKFIRREASLVRYIGVFDWFAPRLSIKPDERRGWRVSFEDRSFAGERAAGILAMLLWLSLASIAIFQFQKRRLYRNPLHIGLSLSLLSNFLLHTFYGDDLFLYSCNTCFLLLAWIALSLQSPAETITRRQLTNFALAVTWLLQLANNTGFISGLLAIRFPARGFSMVEASNQKQTGK